MKKITALLLAMLAVVTLGAAENLLPRSNVAVNNSEAYWHTARNESCTVEFSTNAKKNTFRMDTKTSGYANYRYWLKLKPGVYTVDLLADGRCDSEAIGLEIYSFKAAGKPSFISCERYPAGILRGQRMVKQFTVPSDSVQQRFGLVINGIGTVEFTDPAVYKGKLSVDQLPPRKGVQATKKAKKTAKNYWDASWQSSTTVSQTPMNFATMSTICVGKVSRLWHLTSTAQRSHFPLKTATCVMVLWASKTWASKQWNMCLPKEKMVLSRI